MYFSFITRDIADGTPCISILITNGTYHFRIVRQPDGHVFHVVGFHLEHVPGAFDSNGRDGHTVARWQASARKAEARFRGTTTVVKWIGAYWCCRSDGDNWCYLTELHLVVTTDAHVVVTDTVRCVNISWK